MRKLAASVLAASDSLRPGDRSHRLLAAALALSIAAHLAMVVWMPGFRKPDTMAPRPLDVVIVRAPVPEPMKPERPQPTPPRDVEKRKPRPVRAAPLRQSAPTPAPEPQILALPQALSTPAPAFTVPQASVEPAPPAVEAKPAAPPASAPAPARETIAATAPSFNAAYLRNAPPRYPLIARRNGVEGTVRLRVLVTKDGRAAQVQLEQTSGSPVLDNAALEAVRAWHFVPARRGQEAIESWVVVPIIFKLENVG